jgi:hypothetical protein
MARSAGVPVPAGRRGWPPTARLKGILGERRNRAQEDKAWLPASMQNATAFALLLPLSLAIFGLFGKYSFDMRRDHKYRESWAWACWAILPGFLSALYLTSEGVPVEVRNIALGSLGAAIGACAAIWLGYVIAGAGATSPPPTGVKSPPAAATPIQQNNQGAGQQFNAPSGTINVYPPSHQVPDSGNVTQAGVIVGKAFGARRSPTDATVFEFTEITNCGSLNTDAPFFYDGVNLQFIKERDSVMMLMGRAQDSPIRFGVVAKVLE